MSTYSIKDLEQLSGIKAHTLRIWEQRYGFISPNRTETNIRLYNDEDLKLILNIALLKDNGFKISKIAQMREDELRREVLRLTENTFQYPEQIQALMLCMIDMDENGFESIVSSTIAKLGFEKTMTHIIYPFFQKIGVLWMSGSVNPAQEHFISHLVRQKLMVAIDSQQPIYNENTAVYILFLPDGELHELSLLYAHYIIRSKQHRSIYLGQTLPLHDLEAVCSIHKPNYLLTVITKSFEEMSIQEYIDLLSKQFPNIKILITGYQLVGEELVFPENVFPLTRIDQINDWV